MRQNIKCNLPELDVISFCDSPSPVRRKVDLATTDDLPDEINKDSSYPASSFEFYIAEFSESDNSSDLESANSEEEGTQGRSRKTTNQYNKRKGNSAKNWETIRIMLRDAVIETECIPVGQICHVCNTALANYRCLKCGIGHFFCEPCVASVHTNIGIFHIVEEWKVSMLLLCFFLLPVKFVTSIS
jgi:hypothetical protein